MSDEKNELTDEQKLDVLLRGQGTPKLERSRRLKAFGEFERRLLCSTVDETGLVDGAGPVILRQIELMNAQEKSAAEDTEDTEATETTEGEESEQPEEATELEQEELPR